MKYLKEINRISLLRNLQQHPYPPTEPRHICSPKAVAEKSNFENKEGARVF